VLGNCRQALGRRLVNQSLSLSEFILSAVCRSPYRGTWIARAVGGPAVSGRGCAAVAVAVAVLVKVEVRREGVVMQPVSGARHGLTEGE
jgi:hypothetical protein